MNANEMWRAVFVITIIFINRQIYINGVEIAIELLHSTLKVGLQSTNEALYIKKATSRQPFFDCVL